MLGDMVRVSSETLALLVAAARDTEAPLVVSRYGEVTAPPLLFRRALFPELLAWTGEGCGKAVVQAHRHEAMYVDRPIALLAGGEGAPFSAPRSAGSAPSWSRDGRYSSWPGGRACSRRRAREAPGAGWTWGRRGGEARRVTDGGEGVDGEEWSPGRSKLVLVS